jgi:hypothetical protein
MSKIPLSNGIVAAASALQLYGDVDPDSSRDLAERALSAANRVGARGHLGAAPTHDEVREALAHRAMDKQLYARYRACKRARTRAKQRLTDLREIVAAQRSIVSAAKSEQEASEGPQPAWSGSREFPYG